MFLPPSFFLDMGTNELEVKKKRFKRFFQGLYLQKIMSGIFFYQFSTSVHVKDKKDN